MKRLLKSLVLTVTLLALTVFGVAAQSVPDYYKPLIQKYVDGIATRAPYDTNELGDMGGGSWPRGEDALGYYGYNLTDLNGDGTLELIIGNTTYNGLAAIWTAENNAYKNVFVQIGTDTNLSVIPSVPDVAGSNLIMKSDYLDLPSETNPYGYGYIYRLYQLEGPNKVFKVSYTDTLNGTIYVSHDENNPLETVGSKPDLYSLEIDFPMTPFSSYDPGASSQPATPETPGAIYRLFNGSTGEHLYTPSYTEYQTLIGSGWTGEGAGWSSPDSGEPVYRLFNPAISDHLYTTDANEVAVLTTQQGWQADNNGQPLFYSGGSTPIYRLYNAATGRHHLTKDVNEYNVLPSQGWTPEGQKLSALS